MVKVNSDFEGRKKKEKKKLQRGRWGHGGHSYWTRRFNFRRRKGGSSGFVSVRRTRKSTLEASRSVKRERFETLPLLEFQFIPRQTGENRFFRLEIPFSPPSGASKWRSREEATFPRRFHGFRFLDGEDSTRPFVTWPPKGKWKLSIKWKPSHDTRVNLADCYRMEIFSSSFQVVSLNTKVLRDSSCGLESDLNLLIWLKKKYDDSTDSFGGIFLTTFW